MNQQDSAVLGQLDKARTFPHLSIGHLLLLTFMVSVSLAFIMPDLTAVMRMPPAQLGGHKWQMVAAGITETVSGGVKLFGLIVLARVWMKGQLSFFQPGHWYFLVLGPLALYVLVSGPLTSLVYRQWGVEHFRTLYVLRGAISAAVYLTGVFVCARGVVSVRPWSWKVSLGVLGGWLLASAMLNGLVAIRRFWLPSAWYQEHLLAALANLPLALAGTLIVAMILDNLWRVRRDWLHYLVVVPVLLDAFTTVAQLGGFLQRWWSSAISWLIG